MDRLDAMSVLLAVVDAGSLSAASRQVGAPLSTVSRKISDLEALLGTRLFIRSSRKILLTEAGQSYVAACKRILADVEEAERAASGEYSAPRGDLVVTAPVVFGRLHVLPLVNEFLATYPEIDIRLVLADRVVHLVDDHVDVALRIGALPDSSLVAIRLGDIRRVVCGSPAYFEEHGVPGTPQALSSHACVTFDGLSSPANWTFGAGRAQETVAVHSRLVVNTAEAAIDAAAAGLGVTRVLSYQVAAARRAGQLEIVLADFEPEPWQVSLVHAGQGPLPIKLRAFLDFAAPRLRADLARAGM
jgi:DNA-binding transcriptional LysR family regulator